MSDDERTHTTLSGSEAVVPAPAAAGPPVADLGAGQPPAEAGASPPRRGRFLLELPALVAIAFILALIIKAFLVQAFYIPSGSMEQTLEISDRVLVNKLVYDFRDVHRGEVIVFNGEGSFSPDLDTQVPTEPANPVQRVLRSVGGVIGLSAPGEKDFIKRVIGVPGDRVACCVNGHVTLQRPGGQPVELVEPYTFENDTPIVFCEAGSGDAACPAGAPGVVVPAGRVFVMGDHRCCSSDSRLHLDDGRSGTIPEDKIIGRAFVVVWPLGRAGVLRVPGVFGDRALAGALTGTPYALAGLAVLPVGLWRRRRRLQV